MRLLGLIPNWRIVMLKLNIQKAMPWALAAICLGTSSGVATAGSFTRGCAAKDMQVLMLIEGGENNELISATRATDAILGMLHARMVCHEGRVLEALELYEGIAQSLTLQFGQAK
jgi:hypothetical protein